MTEKELLASLARANAGRDPDRLRIKYARMAADVSAFFRGTAGLFYELLPRDALLRRAPLAWISGDLHLENFGSYRGDNGLAYFDLNDFDEAALAPFSYECVRVLSHLAIAAPTLGIARRAIGSESRLALEQFIAAMSAGKSHWIERRIASGAVRKLLRSAALRSQRDLLNKRSILRRKRRRLIVDGKLAMPLIHANRPAVLRQLQRALDTIGAPPEAPRHFEMLDAARRVAGVGSLGLERYVLLVRGDGTADGARLLDLKIARPAYLAIRFRRYQPRWNSEAARVVGLQRRLQADSPARLSASVEEGKSFVIKELQPTQDRLQLINLGKNPALRSDTICTLMQLSAWSMLRASGWDGAAPGEALTAYVQRSGWQENLLLVSAEMAETMTSAWKIFRKATGSHRPGFR